MSKIVFGVWDGQVTDNRQHRYFEIDEYPEFTNFDEFDPGNPIKAYIGWKGFFIFDKDVRLLDAAAQYMERVAEESCGKCTPCRVGTQILREKLEKLSQGEGSGEDLDEIALLGRHITSTALCGLGQTGPVAIVEMIRYFRKELLQEIDDARNNGRLAHQPGASYVTAPCIEACPARVQIPKYIDYIKDGKFAHSVSVVLQKYPMAETCGRVCVSFCEDACRRTMVDEPVGIKILKRFVAERERYIRDNWFTRDLITDKKPDDLRVAVIGTGPAGISAAYHLLLKGFNVDVFEGHTGPGGMAAVGIPMYRLPKDILNLEISVIETLGGRIFYGKRLGQDMSLQNLFDEGYKSVFLGIGAQRGKMLGIPGENRSQKGYKSGISFLLYINHYYINMGLEVDLGNKMVIVGGGNVAMDCARSALRMGVKEVHLVYRRSREEMPADKAEVEAAEEEGVIFHFLTHPVQIMHDSNVVTGVRLIKMELGEADESGRRSVSPVDGSEFEMDCDFIIPAIGQQVDVGFLNAEDGIEITKRGLLQADPRTLATTRKGVFAGGDCLSGPASLIEAMADGIKGAESISDFLTYGRVRFNADERMSELFQDVQKLDKDYLKVPIRPSRRIIANELDPETRKKIFEEVEQPITTAEAYEEAERCMRCYRVSLAITER